MHEYETWEIQTLRVSVQLQHGNLRVEPALNENLLMHKEDNECLVS